MTRHLIISIIMLLVLVLAPPASKAQPQEPTIYTFTAHFDVPRPQWAEMTTNVEQNVRPVMERMLADGTIESWGNEERIIHEENGTTHGLWWAATSIAGLERVREELIKIPSSPALNNPHHDHLMESIIHRGKTAGPTGGYLYVEIIKLRPGSGQTWRQLWEKYFKPTYDELLDDGTILSYEVSNEYVHHGDPRFRSILTVTPSAEAQGKVDAAYNAIFERGGAAIIAALNSVSIRSEHRDVFARVLNYAHK
ncbi:MAG: hypothetical protein IH951_01875 [Bacteroidetes bacterium]|nr:hypothetical protein [Bacteroidota bacterium]